jgi:putative FmdB family regulatory protein
MPTYQYRCTDCGRDLEVVQKFSDASLTECPTCAGRLRKVFNAVGVVFKGSGFYRNDSRAADPSSVEAKKTETSNGSGEKSGDKKLAETGSGDTSGTKTSGDKPADGKPATKEPSKPDKVSTGSGASSTGSKAAAR